MTSLQETITNDLKNAQKNKDALTVSTLRLLISAFQYALLNSKKEALTNEDVISVIQKQINQRKDSIEQYHQGGRENLKAKEESELHILESYLPKQLTDEELSAIIDAIITETGATSKKEMGMVMKRAKETVQGGADGKRISAIVVNKLQ